MSDSKDILIKGSGSISAEKNYDLNLGINLSSLMKARFLNNQDRLNSNYEKMYAPITKVFKHHHIISSSSSSTTISNIKEGAISPALLTGLDGSISFFQLNFSNAEFRNAVAETDLNLYRYPGNNNVNTFKWQTGIDEANPHTANLLSDVKLMVDGVENGCEVIFALNSVTKTLEDQLEMLSTAQDMGFNIGLVELGNEVYNVDNIGHTVFPTPESYRDMVVVWKAAIKEAFPGVKVSAAGENKTWSAHAKQWVPIILTANPDAIVWHEYPHPEFFVDGNGFIDFVKLDNIMIEDRKIAGIDVVDIPIWVTEYNIKQDDNKGHELTFITDTMRELGILFITKKLTDFGVEVQTMHNIVGTGKNGYFGYTKKNGLFVQTPGRGIQKWFDAKKGMTSMQILTVDGYEETQIFLRKFFNDVESRTLYVNLTSTTIEAGDVSVPAYTSLIVSNNI